MKRKNNIIVGMIFATVMLLTITAGCSSKKSVATKVTIAYNPSSYGSAVSHIMIAENTLDKYLPDGVTAEWVEKSLCIYPRYISESVVCIRRQQSSFSHGLRQKEMCSYRSC